MYMCTRREKRVNTEPRVIPTIIKQTSPRTKDTSPKEVCE